MDEAAGRLVRTGHQTKDGGLARAVLAHEGDFGASAYGKVHLPQDGLFDAEVERHLFEQDDDLSALHRASLARSLHFCEFVSINIPTR